MGESGSDDQNGEPGRGRWDDAVRLTEAYETSEDELVMYDGKNPLAWIKSTFFGVPMDILEPAETDGSDGGGDDH